MFCWSFLLLSSLLTLVSCTDRKIEDEEILPAIRIRILNGCGHRNAASDFNNFMRRHNVDVIGIGNADKFIYDKSIIVVKRDDPQDLKRLMRYSGIKRRVFAIDDHSTESFQIILGKDFRQYMTE